MACGDDAANPTPRGDGAAVDLDPGRDGFAFGNFAASDTDATFDVADLQSMFGAGVDVCLYGDADACEPTAEAAAFARMVNLARSGGHCEGLVVRVAELFAQSPPMPVASLGNSGEVTHGIIRRFATQLFGDVRRDAARWSEMGLAEILAELESTLGEGRLAHTMGLYTQTGGHSVLPYAVTWTDDSVARVSVYDPNWPGLERHVDVDLGLDRWTFSFAATDPSTDDAPWTGGPGTMDLVSLEAREAQRCPFCGDLSTSGPSDAVMLVRSAGSDWSVRTRSGVLTAGVASEVAGSVRPVRADSGTVRDHLVDLAPTVLSDPEARVEIRIDSPARISMLVPFGIVEIQADRDLPVTVVVDAESVASTGGPATIAVSRGILGLAVTGTSIDVRHAADTIAASYTEDGIRMSDGVDASTKTNDPSLSALTAPLPAVLVRPTDIPRVSPGPVITAPPTTTRKPSGPSPVVAETVRVRFDLSEWTLPDDDPGSYGFTASDSVGGRDDETQECRSVACLRRKTVWLPRGGYDRGTGAVILSPYVFRMTGVSVPFEVRCGSRGGWSPSQPGAGGQEASCGIDNVIGDATVHVRVR